MAAVPGQHQRPADRRVPRVGPVHLRRRRSRTRLSVGRDRHRDDQAAAGRDGPLLVLPQPRGGPRGLPQVEVPGRDLPQERRQQRTEAGHVGVGEPLLVHLDPVVAERGRDLVLERLPAGRRGLQVDHLGLLVAAHRVAHRRGEEGARALRPDRREAEPITGSARPRGRGPRSRRAARGRSRAAAPAGVTHTPTSARWVLSCRKNHSRADPTVGRPARPPAGPAGRPCGAPASARGTTSQTGQASSGRSADASRPTSHQDAQRRLVVGVDLTDLQRAHGRRAYGGGGLRERPVLPGLSPG